jgi:hypothetical protein
VAVEIAEAVADSTVVAVVARVAKAEEEDKHQFGNEAICRCANGNSSLNMDGDDNGTAGLLLRTFSCVALFIVQNNSKQVKTGGH